jgi:hypothetical protein
MPALTGRALQRGPGLTLLLLLLLPLRAGLLLRAISLSPASALLRAR